LAVPPITSSTRDRPAEGMFRRTSVGIFRNAEDLTVREDKEHVEGDVGVLHPKRQVGRMEIE